MADGLSIAASAVQVADAGFKLYGALSRYIKDYRDANKHSKRLAEEVRTTSWALQQLGLLLQVDGDLKLCKPEVIDETAAALKGCENAFNEVSEIIEGSIPAVKNGGGASMPMSVRLKWPFKKSKVQLLLAQLERLKTTLMLVFKVLEYASKIASTNAEKDVLLLDEKTQLTFLVKAKQQAVVTERKLLAAKRHSSPRPTQDPIAEGLQTKPESTGAWTPTDDSSTLAATVNSLDRSASNSSAGAVPGSEPAAMPMLTRGLPDLPPRDIFVGAAFIPTGPLPPVQSRHVVNTARAATPSPKAPSKRKRKLVAQLDNCAAAVARLTSTLEQVRDTLHASDALEVHHVTRSFRATKRAVDELVTVEREADSDSATSEEYRLESQDHRRRRPSRSRSLSSPRPPQLPRRAGAPTGTTERAALPHRDGLENQPTTTFVKLSSPRREGSQSRTGPGRILKPLSVSMQKQFQDILSVDKTTSLRDEASGEGRNDLFAIAPYRPANRDRRGIPSNAPKLGPNEPTDPVYTPSAKPAPPPVVPKSDGFRDRISAFNRAGAAQSAHMQLGRQQPGDDYLKEPFVPPEPSRNAYLPPTPNVGLGITPNTSEADAAIGQRRSAEFSGLKRGVQSEQAVKETQDDQPKPMSVRERITALRERQETQYARQAPSRRSSYEDRAEESSGQVSECAGEATSESFPLPTEDFQGLGFAFESSRYSAPEVEQPAADETLPAVEALEKELSEGVSASVADEGDKLLGLRVPPAGPDCPRLAGLCTMEGLACQIDGLIYDDDGNTLGKVVDGNPADLQNATLNDEGEFIDQEGNVLGHAQIHNDAALLVKQGVYNPGEVAEETSDMVRSRIGMSFLQGRVVHKAGIVIGDEGFPVARLAFGNVEELAGKQLDNKGRFRDDSGKVIGFCELLPENEREAKPEGPFAGLEDLRVTEDGKYCQDDAGNLVGEVVIEDSKRFAGIRVDAFGAILDADGDSMGWVEATGQYAEHEQVERRPASDGRIIQPKGPFAELRGLRISEDGRFCHDETGKVVGEVNGPGPVGGLQVDEDGDIVDKYGNIRGRVERISAAEEEQGVTNEDFGLGIPSEGPFAGFPTLRVTANGFCGDEDGNVVGEVVEGNAKRLAGLRVDQDGDVIDKYGNVKGRCEPFSEGEQSWGVVLENARRAGGEGPLAIYGPLHIAKNGKYCLDEHDIPIGKVVEGRAKLVAGIVVDGFGDIFDRFGNVQGRVEPLNENQRGSRSQGPFAGSEGLHMGFDGRQCLDEHGNVVGELVEGRSEELAGKTVDEDGWIIDKYGNVKGRVEPQPEEEGVELDGGAEEAFEAPVELALEDEQREQAEELEADIQSRIAAEDERIEREMARIEAEYREEDHRERVTAESFVRRTGGQAEAGLPGRPKGLTLNMQSAAAPRGSPDTSEGTKTVTGMKQYRLRVSGGRAGPADIPSGEATEDALFAVAGNKIEPTKKKVKISPAELRKKRTERRQRRRRGGAISSDEEDGYLEHPDTTHMPIAGSEAGVVAEGASAAPSVPAEREGKPSALSHFGRRAALDTSGDTVTGPAAALDEDSSYVNDLPIIHALGNADAKDRDPESPEEGPVAGAHVEQQRPEGQERRSVLKATVESEPEDDQGIHSEATHGREPALWAELPTLPSATHDDHYSRHQRPWTDTETDTETEGEMEVEDEVDELVRRWTTVRV